MRQKRRFARLGWILMLVILSVNLSGCIQNPFQIRNSYDSYYEQQEKAETEELKGMAEDLAVIDAGSENTPGFQSNDYADLLINDDTREVLKSYRCFERVYPASVTKIMTALLVMENGDLDDEVTLEHDIDLNEDGAVASTLSKGDTVSVNDLFHGLLVKSANDCAVILAEYIAGTEEKFVDMMNERARELGATHTHFANSHGLHDDNHYTTAYDLYLIFKEVVKHDAFLETAALKDYTMTYVTADGREVSEYMQSTDEFLLNNYPVPEGVTLYGGKTGTTSMAKACLILLTENDEGERFFSVVMGAETHDDLYKFMTKLLENIVNN